VNTSATSHLRLELINADLFLSRGTAFQNCHC
jgi:hypothetical protein